MKVEMLMPQMGESIAEATILKWLKNVGEEVKKDETILEISTDKVDSEIPAPAAGVISEIIAQPGQTVPVKSLIAVIETEKGAAQAKPAAPPKVVPAAEQPTASVKSEPTIHTNGGSQASTPTPSAQPAPGRGKPALKSPVADDMQQFGVGISEIRGQSTPVGQPDDRFYSPLVRNVAGQHGLSPQELSNIPGSGTHGRVTKADVLSYVDARGAAPAEPKSAKAPTDAPPKPQFNAEGVQVIPFDNMRRRIAEHMVRSKATSPHVYSVAEVDVTTIAKWREKNQKSFLDREGFKLSFTPFFLEATTKALQQYPQVNASVDGENLVLKKNVNLGCAVALGTAGLIVPVIKNADQLNLVGIARALNDLASRARSKKLTPDDTQGGTFTVTNPGGFGSVLSYPIINQPQLAILSIAAIKKRPMVVGDAIAIRDIVYLTLSYDHRVIDGALGGTFLNYIQSYLESWDLARPLF